MTTFRPTSTAIFMFLFLVGLGLAAVWFDGTPPPKPATASVTEFSAERAIAHVEQIAQRPHPVGSADHARVRNYVIGEFERLGLKPQRQQATAMQPGLVGRVENVLVRIPGSASTGAALFTAHYDSVGAAPGAADDASGVAALIEGLRAIKSGEPLRNDIIVLITDCEERGQLGAVAFVEQHPWAKDVRVVVNLEARGSSGPALLFETGSGNGAVVEVWASSVSHPIGASLAYEVYKRMPNDTDFSVFKRLDVVGLNFAFIGDPENYHTSRDNLAALNRGSLQHHGASVVALARRFGSADLNALRTRDSVYFSLPLVFVVVRYSVAWALPLALALLALFVWAAVRAWRQKLATIGGIALALVVFAVFGAAAGYWGWQFSRLMEGLHSQWLAPGYVGKSAPYAALLIGVVVSAWCACYVQLRKKFTPHSLLLGSAFIWIIAAIASSWFISGGSYVLLWPAAGSLLSSFFLPRATGRSTSVGGSRALQLALFSLPASLILLPVITQLFMAMGVTPESGVAVSLLTVFALASLVAPLEVVTEGHRWWPAGFALVVSCVCLGTGTTVTHHSAARPQRVNLSYVLDADAHKAWWTANMAKADSWASQYLGLSPARRRPPALVPPWSKVDRVSGYLQAEAPVLELSAPGAMLLETTTSSEGRDRTLTMRVKPAGEGHVLSVWTNGARVVSAIIDGKPAKLSAAPRAAAGTAWAVDLLNASIEGAIITLTLSGLDRLTVAVLDRSFGLPSIPGKIFDPRPLSIVPVQSGDQMIVRRTYTF